MRLARPQITVPCFAIGLLLVLLFDAPIAHRRLPLTFAGLVLGVAVIATPEFLTADREADAD